MGLLDQFSNLSPDQTQGLLAAAAQMLQQSGPSRTPTSFGQVFGGGLSAYQQSTEAARKRKLEEDQAAQVSKLTGLKIQDAESDLANQAAMRERATRLQKFYAGRAQPAGGPDISALGGDAAPTIANADRLSALTPPSGGGQGGSSGSNIYRDRLAEAQALRKEGFGPEADAAEAAALKFVPKVKEWKEIRQGGRTLYAPYFEDGTNGQPVPYDLAVKLEKTNSGATTDFSDPYTGKVVSQIRNTQSPDSRASVAATIRGQDLAAGAPQFNADAGGFIYKPDKANPQGSLVPLAGLNRSVKLTEDQGKATGWLVQAENAYKNMMKVGVDKKGNPTEAAYPGFNDALGNVPGLSPLANTFRSADRQKFIQASSSLSESLLRAATGAGVNKEEAAQKVQELTPIYGEDPEVTKQKYDAIPLYIESLKVRAGPGASAAKDVIDRFGGNVGWGIKKVGD